MSGNSLKGFDPPRSLLRNDVMLLSDFSESLYGSVQVVSVMGGGELNSDS